MNVSVNQLCKRSRLFLADDNLNHAPPPLTGCGQLFGSCQNALLALVGQLKDYFADADFSVQRIEQLMGKFNASFGETGAKGFTVYTCANIQQVVFSILHFLILNGYKFANCKHCGRLYATQNLKNTYCSRTSPYPGYERYYCKDAVKRINDALEKRRKTVYERLRIRANEYGYGSKYGTIFRNFQDKCCEYKATIKENASIENLSAYAAYLQSGEGLPKRYERIKEARL